MRGLLWVGVVLILLGIGGLVVQNVSFTETKKVVDIGPLELHSQKERSMHIPTIAAIVAILAGFGLIVASRRKP
jgi:hypothetical protein